MSLSRSTTRVAPVVALLLMLPRLAAAGTQVEHQNGIAYVSGGVGSEERAALAALSREFDLKLTLALASGDYVGDAAVRVTDAAGKTVLDAPTDGPLFYAQLPPGTYTVTVSRNGGHELQRSARVGDGGQAHLVFTWKAE